MFTQLIVLLILILLNAFFAATEIAFISLNDAKIEIEAKDGNKKAKSIQKMLKKPSEFLATIQIGITLAGFLSSAFASESFADDLAPVLNNLIPALSVETWNTISIVLITIILSYFTLVFGELVPKRLGMKNAEKMAYAAVGVIKGISIVTKPFVKFLTASTNIISKVFGVGETDEETVTEEEIRMMVDASGEKGVIDEEEREMINNVFEFDDKVASEIMIPRKDVYALDMNMTISQVIEEITSDKDFRYSRIPVYDENIDEIKGIVYIKDIVMSQKNGNVKIKNLIKEPYFVPDTISVNDLFEQLRKKRKQIAIVVDEYGGTAGIVTMEDILEEIVGEIYDEYDLVKKDYEKKDKNTYILSGSMSIYDVEKLFDIKIPEGDYDTISGYIIEILGRIPEENETPLASVETEDMMYKVEKVKVKLLHHSGCSFPVILLFYILLRPSVLSIELRKFS